MDAPGSGGPPFAARALALLREWPALRVHPAEGGGAGLAASNRQIVHLHRDDEAELYLTWPVIQRMSAALAESPQIRVSPGGDWVRVGLYSDTDVSVLASLVSVAIQAHAQARRGSRRRDAPCPQSLRAASVLVPAQPA